MPRAWLAGATTIRSPVAAAWSTRRRGPDPAWFGRTGPHALARSPAADADAGRCRRCRCRAAAADDADAADHDVGAARFAPGFAPAMPQPSAPAAMPVARHFRRRRRYRTSSRCPCGPPPPAAPQRPIDELESLTSQPTHATVPEEKESGLHQGDRHWKRGGRGGSSVIHRLDRSTGPGPFRSGLRRMKPRQSPWNRTDQIAEDTSRKQGNRKGEAEGQ